MEYVTTATTSIELFPRPADADGCSSGNTSATAASGGNCTLMPAFALTPSLIAVAAVYGAVFVCGVVGNALVILSVSQYPLMRTLTNVYLSSLASADILLILLCVPVKLVKWLSFTWNFGWFLCKSIHYLQSVSVLCSIFTLTFISLERYHAIVHPLQAKILSARHACRSIVFIWLSSFLLATPVAFAQHHKRVGVIYGEYFWCLKEWSKPLYERIYESLCFVMFFCIPMFTVSFAYSRISYQLHRMDSLRASMKQAKTSSICMRKQIEGTRSSASDSATRRQVIKMLVTVIVLFVICWGPSFVDDLLVAFDVLSRLNVGPLKPLRQSFAVMAYMNSCLNPIVYAFMSRSFRRSFRQSLKRCVRRALRPVRRRNVVRSRPSGATSLTQIQREPLNDELALKDMDGDGSLQIANRQAR